MNCWVQAHRWSDFYYHLRSFICIRCRDAGVIREADLASLDTCRGHLAEDRINDLIKRSGAWWS